MGGSVVVRGVHTSATTDHEDGALAVRGESEVRVLAHKDEGLLTDGEALDIADFGRALAPGSLPDDFFVAIGVLGSGADHDTALASFLPFVRAQRRLKVVRLHSQGGTPGGSGSYSNGHQIADALRDMFKNAQLTAAGWV